MPAKSRKQQQYFGMVKAGKIRTPKGMTEEQVEEFATTPTKRLPKRVRKKR